MSHLRKASPINNTPGIASNNIYLKTCAITPEPVTSANHRRIQKDVESVYVVSTASQKYQQSDL